MRALVQRGQLTAIMARTIQLSRFLLRLIEQIDWLDARLVAQEWG
jgi:hypothetical protein